VPESQLAAAFDGAHGWFWRNRAGKPVTLALRVSGDFARLKPVVEPRVGAGASSRR